jgi:hypothetical protein
MRKATIVILGAVMATAAHAQDSPHTQSPGTQSPATCFSVIEAKANVPPGAPILVDACSGATFILMRTGRGDRKSYMWRPIARGTGAAPPVAKASATAARAAPATDRSGCFSYSGRTFCP